MELAIDVASWVKQNFDAKEAGGGNLRFNCPFCNDGRGRFYILVESDDRSDIGLCYCQNEQRAHSFVNLYSRTENISFREAEARLHIDAPEIFAKCRERFEKYINRNNDDVANNATSKAAPISLPSSFVPMFGLSDDIWQRVIPKYLLDRGVTQQLCEDYKLHICKTGRFANRLIIPIYYGGTLVGYQGRALTEKIVPKYLFMNGIKAGDFLFNLDNVTGDSVILTEGVFDVWGVLRSGNKNVVCGFGKHLSAECRAIIKKQFKSITVMWDTDAFKEAGELCERLGSGIERKIAMLSSKDPGSASPDEINIAISGAKCYNFYEHSHHRMLAALV